MLERDEDVESLKKEVEEKMKKIVRSPFLTANKKDDLKHKHFYDNFPLNLDLNLNEDDVEGIEEDVIME